MAVITISHHSLGDSLCPCWLYESLQGRSQRSQGSSSSPTDNVLLSRDSLSALQRARVFIHPSDNPERLGPGAPVPGEETDRREQLVTKLKDGRVCSLAHSTHAYSMLTGCQAQGKVRGGGWGLMDTPLLLTAEPGLSAWSHDPCSEPSRGQHRTLPKASRIHSTMEFPARLWGAGQGGGICPHSQMLKMRPREANQFPGVTQ